MLNDVQETSETAARDHAVELLRDAVAGATHSDGIIAGKVEAQVHNAIDFLRGAGADVALILKFEQASCLLYEMNHLRRQGRVNAYASKLLRLRRTVELI